ncbi:flagellin [Ethanoligenens harbinense]|uniref:Flagellin n=1 Tax=Ethanoligenens harbinense (strain DSM 18485 / JCM 12961 / CGMCC 1.5033 / YUAN-3) TaxID=663278 RepID=E6U6H1_ETHHY|nr:flagellin [Ethanoligenens harbinense]ADU28041.1 flagellin domain protein [Ethanoligenens harbinense YUAN-3]
MVINHNIAALNTLSNLQKNTSAVQDSLQKLSTGSKINKAADDASGLAISQKMQAQINGLNQAQENVSNGNSLIQTSEGALGNVQDILQKMRTLAVQAQNDTQNDTDKSNLQDQANALAQEINRISDQTTYNTKNVFGQTDSEGLFSNSGLQIQIGADSGQTINLTLGGTVVTTSTLVSASAATSATGSTTLSGDAADGYQYFVSTSSGTDTYAVTLNTASDGSIYATFKDSDGNQVMSTAVTTAFTAAVSATTANGTTTYSIANSALFTAGNITATTINYDLTGVQGGTAGTAVSATAVTLVGSQTTTGGTNIAATDTTDGTAGADPATATVTINGVAYTASLYSDSSATTVMQTASAGNVYFTLTDADGNVVKDSSGSKLVFTGTADASKKLSATGLNVGGKTASVTLGTATYTANIAGSGTNTTFTLTDVNGQVVKDTNGETATFTGSVTGGQLTTNSTTGKINVTESTSYLDAVSVSALGVGTGVGEAATALSLTGSNAINTIQTAIDTVSKLRSKMGAYQNRFTYAGDTLDIESQNLTAAQSTLTDTDVAQEMMNYTKNNILVQSAQAMLAQANQLPQGMLSLLKS